MRVWGKMSAGPRLTIGVARAALAGKGQHDLLSEAVQNVCWPPGRRIGLVLGLNLRMMPPAIPLASPAFRGIVADTENDPTPGEWSRLSPEPPLPQTIAGGPAKLSSRS